MPRTGLQNFVPAWMMQPNAALKREREPLVILLLPIYVCLDQISSMFAICKMQFNGEGNGNLLQHSWLGNAVGRGAW